MSNTNVPRNNAGALVIALLAAATFLPLLGLLLAALQAPGSLVAGLSWPSHPHWSNFRLAWNTGNFATLMRSSVVVEVVVVPVSLLLTCLAGYAFSQLPFRGSRALYAIVVLGLTVPVELIVVPLFYDMQSLQLTNSYVSVMLAEVGTFIPFGIYWLSVSFAGVPQALIESARCDGASTWRILWQVVVPVARSSIVTLAVLYVIWSWNQFLLALVLLQDPAKRTAPSGLGLFVGEHTTDVPLLCAATIIVMLPPLVFYLIFQRSFITGMLSGAVKG